MAKDTEQGLVLAPRFYWRLFLQPKLKGLLIRKYPHRKLKSDDISVVVSATRQKGFTRRFDRTYIDWSSIEKQLFDWGGLFLAGKTLKLGISFNYTENTLGSTNCKKTGKRGASSATSACFKSETNRSVPRKKYLESLPPGRWYMP